MRIAMRAVMTWWHAHTKAVMTKQSSDDLKAVNTRWYSKYRKRDMTWWFEGTCMYKLQETVQTAWENGELSIATKVSRTCQTHSVSYTLYTLYTHNCSASTMVCILIA